MHRRVIKSLASTMGAVALVVAPIALMAPAQAAPIVLDESNTDDTVPFINGPSPTGTNHEAYWVNYLASKNIMGATCVKAPGEGSLDEKTWVIPAPPAGTQFALVTTKAASQNALEEGQNANLVWWAPKAAEGNTVTAVAGKNISHVIWCTIPKTTPPPSTTPPVTTPPVTGPVVETDRVADTGPAAGLGLAAGAAALIAGVGAMLFGRRRQGSHR